MGIQWGTLRTVMSASAYERTYSAGLLNVRCWLSRWPWVSQFLEVAIVEVLEDIETDFVFSERLGVLDEAKSFEPLRDTFGHRDRFLSNARGERNSKCGWIGNPW